MPQYSLARILTRVVKSGSMRFGIHISIVVASIIGCFTQQTVSATAGKTGPKIGDIPPALQLVKMVQGPSLPETQWDRLKGKVVVLEYWEISCAPCVAAIPHWNELVDQFKEKPVVFLSVSSDFPETLKSFLERRPIKGWVSLEGLAKCLISVSPRSPLLARLRWW